MTRKSVGPVILAALLLSGCASRADRRGLDGFELGLPSWNPVTTDGIWRAKDGSTLTVAGERLVLDAGCGLITFRRLGGEEEIEGLEGRAYRVNIEAAEAPPVDARYCPSISPGKAVLLVQGISRPTEAGVWNANYLHIFHMMDGDMIYAAPFIIIPLSWSFS